MDEARRAAALKFLDKTRRVDGWLGRSDGLVFLQVSERQVSAGLTADLLEIGAFRGRSAILLGYLLEAGERLFVCDPFEGPASKVPGRALWVDGKRHYPGLTQAGFDRNYARYHATPPVVRKCSSADLLPQRLVAGPLRLVHIDGSYEPTMVEQDLATALALLAPGGVVVFEDDHSQHNPGVAPAVLAALARGDLRALCLTPWKLFATVGADALGLVPVLRAWAEASADFRVATAALAGHETLLLYPVPELPGPWRALDRKACRR